MDDHRRHQMMHYGPGGPSCPCCQPNTNKRIERRRARKRFKEEDRRYWKVAKVGELDQPGKLAG